MRSIIMIMLLLACWPVIAQDQVPAAWLGSSQVLVGDTIKKVQAKLGKPHFTYEVQNPYGGVIGYDYVWNIDGDDWTFVVTMDGQISGIWRVDDI